MITSTNPSNQINEFLPGVSFNLLKPTGSESLSFDISFDSSQALSAINDFVKSFNEIIQFREDQKAKTSNGKFAPTAVLKHESFSLDTLYDKISSAVTLPTLGSNLLYPTLDLAGIKLPVDPTGTKPLFLSIDNAALTDAIKNNFDAIKKLFQFSFTADSANLNVYKRGNKLFSPNIIFNIDPNQGSDAVQVNINGNVINAAFKANNVANTGGQIIGLKNTPLEGYVFGYSGIGAEIINVSVNQGVADKIYNEVSAIILPVTGSKFSTIDLEVLEINDEISDGNEKIESGNERVKSQMDIVKNKYNRLDLAQMKAGKTSDLLQAQGIQARKGKE